MFPRDEVQGQLKLLDCTLRDGGYYTNWDFDPDLVSRYLVAVAEAGVDFIEVGLRSFPREGFAGPFAYTTEEYLGGLAIPEGVNVGVMVDAKTILGASMPVVSAVRRLFLPRDESAVTLVRVAAHFSEVQDCAPIVNALKELGYLVGVNLMQASGKPANEIESKLSVMLSGCVIQPDVMYFADSLGNMDASDVERLYSTFRRVWGGAVGIHTHNNQGLAVSNSLKAMEVGVSWVDATIQGMGRGAGNAEMEVLLTEIGAEHGRSADSLYKLALDDFGELRTQHRWGPSLLYYFSAKHGIHPTYAQELLAEDRYSTAEKVAILQHLAQVAASSFNKSLYVNALSLHFSDGVGTWDATDFFSGKSVLLIAAGPSSERYAKDLISFAQRKKAIVLSINTVSVIPATAVDAVVTADANRIRFESNILHDLKKPVLAPVSCLPEDCTQRLAGLSLMDFGLRVAEGEFALSVNSCTLPYALSAVYGLAAALAGDAECVYTAGLDGYGPGDPRQKEMADSIDMLKSLANFKDRVVAVTPTSYPIRQGSLYAP